MKKIIISGIFFAAGLFHAQSTTENYVQSKSCLDADCVKKAETVQYMDGLARPKQIVNVKASPQEKDVVNVIQYDQYSRQTKDYLPIPQPGTQNGSIYSSPLANASSVYGGEKIYSEKILESSPLDRVMQQKQVGTAWETKPVNFSYDVNSAPDGVKKFTLNNTTENNATKSELTGFVLYSEGQLYKNSVKDEDGNETIEFKNSKGQTILVRKMLSDSEKADTYYVYNKYDQLVFVIPPLASVSSINTTVLDNLCYQYKYDGRSRLVEKKIPGKGWEYMLYDKQDRLVATQDSVLKEKGQWMYTKYDQFGRVAITGIGTGYQRSVEQNTVNGFGTNNVNRLSTPFFNRQGIDVYYGNPDGSYPNSSNWVTLLSLTYYDTYPPLPAGVTVPPYIITQQQPVLTDTAESVISTKSLPVASYVKNIEDDNWTKTFTWYDTKGRVVGTYSINHLGGYTKAESELDFTGVPQKTSIYHLRKQDETGITIKERFVYDNQNRLLQHYHQVDSKPEELLVQNEYNQLSQLTNKKVGNNLQSIDYSYNIRGWMTDINRDQMSLPDMGGKLFSYKIKYNQKEGIENPDQAQIQFSGKNVKAKYNGNIAEVDWRAVEALGVNPSSTPKRYGYAYDNLNRLTAGYYQNPNNPYSKENTESLTYDLNGNITNLYRSSVLENLSTTATVIDNLGYVYGTGGNQVTNINDISQNFAGYEGGGGTIGYDLNGNMTTMPDKGISTIKYNFLNLPNNMMISKNGNENIIINTKYRADGTKLRKENTTDVIGFNGSVTTINTTDYLDGFQYLHSVNLTPPGGGGFEMLAASALSRRAMEPQAFSLVGPVDTDPTIDPPFGGGGIIVDVKTPDLQFFPTAEGFYDYQKNQYIYQYKDHLGNARISFARNNTGALEITDANDYYPFGMNHLKTGNAYFGQGSYKNYKYNGKELQESGMYDYGARFYMPDIGRWGVVDELAEKSRRFSTYTYALDNPIMFVDPDGREAQQCCSWSDTKRFFKGAWNTGTAMVKDVVFMGGLSGGMSKSLKDGVGVGKSYQQGGFKSVAKQTGSLAYEGSGAKGIIQTAKQAAKGNPEAIGSLTVTAAAVIITHKAGGASTMSELTNTVKSTVADLKAAGKAPATVVGAELNGQTVVGTSGPQPATIAPQLEGVVGELGGLGTKTASGNTVGCCSEFHTGNQLLLDNPSATPSQINFTEAIRPRDGSVIPMCANCKTTFNK